MSIMRRRWPWVLLAVLLAPAFLLLSCSPAAQPLSPTAADVAAAREVYSRVNALRGASRPLPIAASWRELAAVAELGGRTAGFANATFLRDGERGVLVASLPLAPHLWLNARAFLAAGQEGQLRVSGRLGLLPVPARLVHAAIELSRNHLHRKGADIPPLDELVMDFAVGDRGLSARMRLPGSARMLRTLSALREEGIDTGRVAAHYCRLVEAHHADPQRDFAVLVRRVFGGADGTAADNRAAFMALAVLVAGTEVGLLAAERRQLTQRCGEPDEQEFELLGRSDLVKHWSVSAALAAAFGSQASISVGIWKEISDSGDGGSGFSLVDLAADRSGVFCAEKSAQAEQAGDARAWLAQARQEDLLPVSALALAEGMSEEQFRSRYTSVDSPAFSKTVEHIDKTLAVLIRFDAPKP
ncbi:MAG: hypothetical protein QM696_03990 [Steroidobacteraceae bacterium]